MSASVSSIQTFQESAPQEAGLAIQAAPGAVLETVGQQIPAAAGLAGGRVLDLFAFVEYVLRVHRERNQLRKLDPRMMKDLGLSQDMVAREAGRSLLDVPADRPDRVW
ncbi:MAG TPA: DUF1127 domain-containing protein [Hyphomicrobiaceae bacterium]|nr:DUF1127 domain-containing protein [Hyphomicrobiaceae bacterium]